MAPIEFRAPWSKELRTATVISIVILLGVALAAMFVEQQIPLLLSATLIGLPLLAIVGSLLAMVRGYVLTDEAIIVRRGGWETRLPLAGLRSVAGDIEAMQRSIRLFGNGGLFSFSGEFWNRKLGRFRALATDPSRAVILRYSQRTIVITPHDPQQFIMRAGTLLKTAGFPSR